MERHFFGCHAVYFSLGFRDETESFKCQFFGFFAHLCFFNDRADVGQAAMFMFVRQRHMAEGASDTADKFVLKMDRTFELGKDSVQNGVCFFIVHAEHAH